VQGWAAAWIVSTDSDFESKLAYKISKGLKSTSEKEKRSSIKVVFELLAAYPDKYENESLETLKERFSSDLARFILHKTSRVYAEPKQAALRDDFIRRAIVNRKDEFGNTMLHLAAWNSNPDMFDYLVKLGADSSTVNDDGLTPFTLSARFGRWQMYEHIWKQHFTRPYWQFGKVQANLVDYSQFETGLSGIGTALSFRDLERFVKLLVLKTIAHEIESVPNNSDRSQKEQDAQQAQEKPGHDPHKSCTDSEAFDGSGTSFEDGGSGLERQMPVALISVVGNKETLRRKGGHGALETEPVNEKSISAVSDKGTSETSSVHNRVRTWCEKKIGSLLIRHIFGSKDSMQTSSSEHKSVRIQQYSSDFRSATELITLFRPSGWQTHAQKLMEKHVLSKWDNGFYLVHFADTVVPYGVLLLLFCLMWWQRKLSILEHHFWWSATTVVAPTPDSGVEGACGWEAIRHSYSGRLQATLIVYGVPSLLRLAWVQSRLKPMHLDENLDWKVTENELVSFIFMNLESLFHLSAAVLFVIIGVSRVVSPRSRDMFDCSVESLRTEKTCTAIAALVLFFNLFIVCKPYRGLGVLVQTMYRFLLKDVFHFLVMYGMLFVAFLLALQTLYNADREYLTWMDNTNTILPQVEKAQNLAYLANDNIPSNASSLLATETVLEGCWNKRQTLTDTALTLMEISFGDGLADSLDQARNKPYECAGFSPDSLPSGLLVFWVFVTNVLFLNMLIAMMNKTFDDEMKSIKSNMLLDLSYRIMRYERTFPEIADQIQQFDSNRGVSYISIRHLKLQVKKLLLVLKCLPEVHFLHFAFVDLISWIKTSKRLDHHQIDLWGLACKAVEINGFSQDEEIFCSNVIYRKMMSVSLDSKRRRLIELVERSWIRYPPLKGERGSSFDNQSREQSEQREYTRKCLGGLIYRLDSLIAALMKAHVSKELVPWEKKAEILRGLPTHSDGDSGDRAELPMRRGGLSSWQISQLINSREPC
jgi:hypothetical protein